MTSFDRDDLRRPGYYTSSGVAAGSAPILIGAAVVVVLLVGAVWYGFKGVEMTNSPGSAPMHQTTTESAAPMPPAQPAPPKP
jgi:hypothetical protein